MSESPKLYGVAAEFATHEDLLAAVTVLQSRPFGVVDAYSPLPIPGMDEALGLRGPILGWVTVFAVVLSGLGCFAMISFATVSDYPLNIGARPVWSWPLYLIPSFAAAMASGAVVVFVAMLFLDRLPRINHPVFEIDGSERITQDRFFVAVEARSESFDIEAVELLLVGLPKRPLRIQRVPR